MANRYWVGGSATWDGTAGTKWSTTSGGAGGSAVPTAADDVFFDAASGAVTITNGAGALCRSLTCTGFTGAFTGFQNLSVGDASGGSFTLSPGMTYTRSGNLTFRSTTTGNQITCAGKSLPHSVIFNGVGGAWSLQDSMNLTGGGGVTLTAGALDTNSKTCSWGFYSNNSGTSAVRSLTLGSSSITLTSGGNAWLDPTGVNYTASAASATINFLTTSFLFNYFGPFAYGTINFSPATNSSQGFFSFEDSVVDTFIIQNPGSFGTAIDNAGGSATFNNLTISASNKVLFTSGKTFTISNNLTAIGGAGTEITITSTSSGFHSLVSSSAIINCNYCLISSSHASGGASFNAGLNSSDLGGNSGWFFNIYLSEVSQTTVPNTRDRLNKSLYQTPCADYPFGFVSPANPPMPFPPLPDSVNRAKNNYYALPYFSFPTGAPIVTTPLILSFLPPNQNPPKSTIRQYQYIPNFPFGAIVPQTAPLLLSFLPYNQNRLTPTHQQSPCFFYPFGIATKEVIIPSKWEPQYPDYVRGPRYGQQGIQVLTTPIVVNIEQILYLSPDDLFTFLST